MEINKGVDGSIWWPEMGDFNSFDEAAEYICQVIKHKNLPDKILRDIKNDLFLMANGDIKQVGFPMLPRYLGVYHTDLLPELIKSYVSRYSVDDFMERLIIKRKPKPNFFKTLFKKTKEHDDYELFVRAKKL